MRIAKIVASATVCLGLVALTARPAEAGGQHREVLARFTAPYELSVDCADYGPYDFENSFSGWQRLAVTEVYGTDGTLQKLIVSSTFREVDRNTTSGSSVLLRGALTEVTDFAAGTLTLTGNIATGRLADGDIYLREIGQLVMTLDSREPLFVAGPHEALEAGGVNPVVCEALATQQQ